MADITIEVITRRDGVEVGRSVTTVSHEGAGKAVQDVAYNMGLAYLHGRSAGRAER